MKSKLAIAGVPLAGAVAALYQFKAELLEAGLWGNGQQWTWALWFAAGVYLADEVKAFVKRRAG